MQKFAERFSSDEWKFLTTNQRFLAAVSQDIQTAWILAIGLLAKYYSAETRFKSHLARLINVYLSAGLSRDFILNELDDAAFQIELITGREDDDFGEELGVF
ncbi:hypothetical protein TSACC_21676 [Terrimicrobium sacchariphilum]|uniref:Uncharacterized protein n=1 Tax=Terrimicrobium sacchariphilum TaxID=690879 RepID=A0A146G7D0_TERSA|nr:hypothetical protein [Terrimicrobium sacchariphilum]GAT33263.1 hypothetical protein TSACC_21676 [Terrimicrobium sacchariphilum]